MATGEGRLWRSPPGKRGQRGGGGGTRGQQLATAASGAPQRVGPGLPTLPPTHGTRRRRAPPPRRPSAAPDRPVGPGARAPPHSPSWPLCPPLPLRLHLSAVPPRLLLRTPPALRMTTTRASGSWRSAARRCANWAASGPPALRTSARQACLRSSSCRLSRLPGSATSAANTKRCVARPPHLPSARECGGSQACLWSRGLAYALLTSRPRGASIRTSCRDARTASAATSPQCAASARRCSHALTSREAGVCGTATRITRSSTGSRGTRQSAEVAPPAKAALPAIVARQGGGKKEGGAVEGKGTAHGPPPCWRGGPLRDEEDPAGEPRMAQAQRRCGAAFGVYALLQYRCSLSGTRKLALAAR